MMTLAQAIRRGNIEAVQRLVQQNTPNKITALHNAIWPYSTDTQKKMVPILINGGVPVHTRDEHGQTALHIAAKYGYLQAVELLVNAGADINARDNQGKTPLHVAVEKDNYNHYTIIPTLVHLGALVNAQDHEGNTPLHLAVIKRHMETAGKLLDLGADPSIRNHGQTPLEIIHPSLDWSSSYQANFNRFMQLKNMIKRSTERRKARKAAIHAVHHLPKNIKMRILSETGLFDHDMYGRKRRRHN